jgi:hypothetical protein
MVEASNSTVPCRSCDTCLLANVNGVTRQAFRAFWSQLYPGSVCTNGEQSRFEHGIAGAYTRWSIINLARAQSVLAEGRLSLD